MTIARRIHNFLHPKLGCILMLHRVSAECGIRSSEFGNRGAECGVQSAELSRSKSMMISPMDLEVLINNYRQKGWRFVSIDQVSAELGNRGSEFPGKAANTHKFVCLTLDDGYLDTYTTAYPLLSHLQIPFCVYMTRDFYRGTATPSWDNKAKMMNVEQLLEMSRDLLCTIGAHTCSHPRLSGLSTEEQHLEILECKDDLEHILGKEVRHFAYPHGDYNKKTIEIVNRLGFKTAVTTSGRYVRDDSDMLELDRIVSF